MKDNGRIIRRLYLGSAVSIIAAAVAAMLGIIIDGVVIGRFMGTDCMAAYGLVTPIVNLTTACSGVLTTGAQVICAQRLGAGRVDGARRAFSMTMIITLSLSAVLMGVLLLFRDGVCVMLGARGASAHLLPLASEYILGMLFSIPCVLLLFEFNSLMRLDGDGNRVIVAVAVMTALDIAGDLLNALVVHGGMFGMGLTTSISYLVALIIMLLHFRKKNILLRFSCKGLKLRDMADILITGSSSGVGSVCVTVRNTVMNRIMVATALSSVAVAALGVLNTLVSFTSAIMIGIGMTCAMIAGMILGERDRSAARALVRVTAQVAAAAGAVLTAVLLIFADHIAGFFGSEQSAGMVALAARGIRLYALSMVFCGLNNAFVNYTQGMRRMGVSNLFCFLQNFVFAVLPALALAGTLQSDAVWLSYLITESAVFLTILIYAAVRKRGVPYRIDDFLFLKEPFGAAKEDTFEVSLSRIEDVLTACEAVKAFALSRSADDDTVSKLSLFTREMCDNIIRHGFADGRRHSIDLRLVRTDGWVLRLRDNCRLFDPTEWIREHIDRPDADSGLLRVYRTAGRVTYLNTLDLNILTIEL